MLFFAALFTVATMGLTWVEQKFAGVEMTSEHFNTAGRNVKTGLTASVIVSQWTWAATLLQSSNVAWQYGVTGPFWYAAGASVQIILFGIIAIEIKRKAPNAHTFLELIDVRWGQTAHSVFMFFGIATQTIVSSSAPPPSLCHAARGVCPSTPFLHRSPHRHPLSQC
jgi:urea-proton symporter